MYVPVKTTVTSFLCCVYFRVVEICFYICACLCPILSKVRVLVNILHFVKYLEFKELFWHKNVNKWQPLWVKINK